MSKKENIFDLTKLVSGRNNDIEVKSMASSNVISDDDKETSLIGYTLVPKNEWEHLGYKTHVRYQKSDGAFKKGGFVTAVWKTKSDGEDTIKIDLVNNFNAKKFEWSIYANKIDKIWKKTTLDKEITNKGSISNEQISDLTDDIEFCKESIKHLKKEMQNINNELVRTIKFIKKLHGLK